MTTLPKYLTLQQRVVVVSYFFILQTFIKFDYVTFEYPHLNGIVNMFHLNIFSNFLTLGEHQSRFELQIFFINNISINWSHLPNVVSILIHRLRRHGNIKTTLGERLVFAWGYFFR